MQNEYALDLTSHWIWFAGLFYDGAFETGELVSDSKETRFKNESPDSCISHEISGFIRCEGRMNEKKKT